ncbi:hypothetical protein PHMEG_00010478 [Phytophthora megakarya]|uniref:Uncharacterized protein n=1 Tax=Phytophthora megakarya TaxID=4795 RepID=A0A225WE57_9STRA|nr:hypothetical protein PHMEG_00010478 [Phytophthora megakarya]
MPTTAICMLRVKWREQCWMSALNEAMETETATSQRWARLKAWRRRFDLVSASYKQQQLRQEIMNSTEEWVIEQHEKYGRSAVLRLCALKRNLLFGHYLPCGYVYSEKIAVFIGSVLHASDPIALLLERHLLALRGRDAQDRELDEASQTQY